MLNKSFYEKGLQTMRAMLGDSWLANHERRHAAAAAAGDAEREEFTATVLFGYMWHRPQLSQRDRAIVMVTSDIVQNTPAALRSHLDAALQVGITRDEIEEMVFYLTQYCGHPKAREARIVIEDYFAKRDASRS